MMKKKLLLALLFPALFCACDNEKEPIINSIQIISDNNEINVDEVVQLEVEYQPKDLKEPAYLWESSNKEIAIVYENGTVEGKSEGNCTIYVTAVEENLKDSLEIKVNAIVSNLSITLNPAEKVIAEGNTFRLECITTGEINHADITFESSDPKIATIDSTGLITAISKGKTQIVAKIDSISATCEITVIEEAPEAESVDLNPKELRLKKEETYQLESTILPLGAEGKLIYMSANSEIATVDENGLITAIAIGDTYLTVRIDGTDISTSCNVTVAENDVKPESIQLNETEINLEKEGTFQLESTILPEGNEEKIVYVSANPEITTINENGLITAVNSGDTYVTARIENTDISASCNVKVAESETKPEAIQLNQTEINLKKEETFQIVSTITPEGSKGKIKYVSTNPEIATVNENGLITAKLAGSTSITVQIENTDISASCSVNVSTDENKDEPEDIQLNQTKVEINNNETFQLVSTILPAGTAGVIIYSSSYPEVATVDNNGLIHAKAAGNTVITSHIEGTNISASCNVKVSTPDPESIELNKTEVTIKVNEVFQLESKIIPAGAQGKLTFMTHNRDVSIVDRDGTIIGLSEGTTYITVGIENNPNIAVSCKVNVIK